QFNLATQGERQPGSSFKPFVLATALRDNIAPSSTLVSEPVTINADGRLWKVENYEGEYLGRISLSQAIAYSDNSVFSQLTALVGPRNVRDTARALGITSQLNGHFATGQGRATARPPGRGQDRHDGELRRCVVRRLHAPVRRRRLGRLPGQAHPDDDGVPRQARCRRHVSRADLESLHAEGTREEGADGLHAARLRLRRSGDGREPRRRARAGRRGLPQHRADGVLRRRGARRLETGPPRDLQGERSRDSRDRRPLADGGARPPRGPAA